MKRKRDVQDKSCKQEEEQSLKRLRHTEPPGSDPKDGHPKENKQAVNKSTSDRILRLNVGGRIFPTTERTLCNFPHSLLANMFASEYPQFQGAPPPMPDKKTGSYFIDRDPMYFMVILNFYRDRHIDVGTLKRVIDPWMFRKEAIYYGLPDLLVAIENAYPRCKYCHVSKLDEKEIPDCQDDKDASRVQHMPAPGTKVTFLQNPDDENVQTTGTVFCAPARRQDCIQVVVVRQNSFQQRTVKRLVRLSDVVEWQRCIHGCTKDKSVCKPAHEWILEKRELSRRAAASYGLEEDTF